jgi:hypothetical protein
MSRLIIAITLLSLFGAAFSTTCKDGSSCPGTYTCCLTPRGVGCCPYTNANCCGDGLHCCPNGYQCNTAAGTCTKSEGSDEFLTFLSTKGEDLLSHLTPSTKSVESEVQVNLESMGTPSVTDIIKCISDIKPVAGEVVEIVTALKNGDTSKITEVLLQLAKDGYQLGTDCAKVIEDIVKSSN